MALLAFATRNVPALGAETAKLSMIWLVLAYLFHTLGELCLSPMGLSYLSKLIPARMVAFMFGVYYLAIAIGNKLAHYIGGDIEKISNESGSILFLLNFHNSSYCFRSSVLCVTSVTKKTNAWG